MKTQHTPGPWEVDCAAQPIIVNGPPEGVADQIAVVYDCECPPAGAHGAYQYGLERAAANARLIAAAPELLAALERMVECYKLNPTVWEEARAAIEKAKGAP